MYTYRAAEVVKQYPNVMVMLKHCGLPYQRDEPSMKLWKEGNTHKLYNSVILIVVDRLQFIIYAVPGLEELSKYPNVYCKLSGVFVADQSCDVSTFMETCARPCLEIFGVNRYVICII